MSTAAESKRFFSLQHLKDSLNSFMFSGAMLNLSLWILLTTETPQEGKKAWQGKVKSWPWHVQILKTVVHMCGRQCLAITEAKLSSTGDGEVVTPCFWETW